MEIRLILGNQLFPDLEIRERCLMIEGHGLASRYRYHPLRIYHQFLAMREYRDELKAKSVKVDYFEADQSSEMGFFQRIESVLKKHGADSLVFFEIPDVAFRSELMSWAQKKKIKTRVLPSPQFLVSSEEFADYLKRYKKPFMKTFYEGVRKKTGVLMTPNGTPEGGQWSFDVDNRKKLPKGIQVPKFPDLSISSHQKKVHSLVRSLYSAHPGDLPDAPDLPLWLPVNRKESLEFMEDFITKRLKDFGPFEDAISNRSDFVFHSGLSPLINLGLLQPAEVVESVLKHGKKKKVPLESLEGFVRQVIGWREFIRGIHENFHESQSTSNFFRQERKMKSCWYEGSTGLPPVDDAIRKAKRLAYNHHIERLMILSNVMLLSELHPHEVHRWFMEMYLDSYEWVMGPNVFGMAQFSDGGIFATKPYISGSNYILKMSDYEKGDWCEIWDGLYWSFIHRHRSFFGKNPRLSMMAKMLDKMDSKKKFRIFELAENFKNETSTR